MKKIILGSFVFSLLLAGVSGVHAQTNGSVSVTSNATQQVSVTGSAPVAPSGGLSFISQKQIPVSALSAAVVQSAPQSGFSGIGAVVAMQNGVLTVINPIIGAPAYSAGIRAGDEILNINAAGTGSMTIDQAVSQVRGDAGTSVTLTVLHKGSEQSVQMNIIRAYINLAQFSSQIK